MRIAYTVLAFGCGVALAQTDDGPTAAEEKAVAAVAKLGGKATIDPKQPKEARVAAKFDAATDATLLGLKKHPEVGAVDVFDAAKCTDKGFAALKDLPHLRRLVVGTGSVSEKSLGLIGDAKELRNLGLINCGVTDAGLGRLKKLTRLETLDLSGNPKVTDKGMAVVKTFERLEHLYLAETSITDKGLFELKPLDGLRTLNATATKVTADGATKFADEMPNLRVVRR